MQLEHDYALRSLLGGHLEELALSDLLYIDAQQWAVDRQELVARILDPLVNIGEALQPLLFALRLDKYLLNRVLRIHLFEVRVAGDELDLVAQTRRPPRKLEEPLLE